MNDLDYRMESLRRASEIATAAAQAGSAVPGPNVVLIAEHFEEYLRRPGHRLLMLRALNLLVVAEPGDGPGLDGPHWHTERDDVVHALRVALGERIEDDE
jgi:hypothetical protein